MYRIQRTFRHIQIYSELKNSIIYSLNKKLVIILNGKKRKVPEMCTSMG